MNLLQEKHVDSTKETPTDSSNVGENNKANINNNIKINIPNGVNDNGNSDDNDVQKENEKYILLEHSDINIEQNDIPIIVEMKSTHAIVHDEELTAEMLDTNICLNMNNTVKAEEIVNELSERNSDINFKSTVTDKDIPYSSDDKDCLGNNDTHKSTCNDWINLVEFDTILKSQMKASEEPLNLDEIDEYIRNIDEPLINNKYEFITHDIQPTDSENLDDLETITISSDDVKLSPDTQMLHDEPNIDTISINSSISDYGSYHSSDFEFITEEEAKLEGFIITYKPPKKSNVRKEPLVIRREFSDNDLNTPSSSNIAVDKENLPLLQRQIVTKNVNLRENHIVPEGPNFLALFQGVYDPVLSHSEILLLENKSVRVTSMHTQFNGLGFDRDMAIRNRKDPHEEFEDEAKDNARKILEMYPIENRKRRRRY